MLLRKSLISLSLAIAWAGQSFANVDEVFQAIVDNQSGVITHYIDEAGDLSIIKDGKGLLHECALNTRFGIAQRLIASGRMNPLAVNQQGKRADQLVAAGKTFKLLKDTLNNALKNAVVENNINFIRDYLETESAVDEPVDAEGNTLLHLAAVHARLSIAEQLFAAGANPGIRDNENRIPLSVTTGAGKTHRLILRKTNEFYTRLKDAAAQNQAEVFQGIAGLAKMDLDRGVDEEGNTLLHHSVVNSRAAITQILRGAGAKLETRNNAGRSVVAVMSVDDIFSAVLNNQSDIIELYIALPGDLSIKKDNKGLLHVCAENTRLGIAQKLIESGRIDSLAVDAEGKRADQLVEAGRTAKLLKDTLNAALKNAVVANDRDVIRTYLNTEHSVNAAIDDEGNTLLHIAAAHARKGIAEDLIGAGVNFGIKNNANKIPLEVTTGAGQTHRLILDRTNTLYASLKDAAENDRAQTFTDIADLARMNLDRAVDDQGNTLLHIVVNRENYEVLNVLFSAEVRTDVLNAEGYTAQGLDGRGFYRNGTHSETGTEFGTDHLTQAGSAFGRNNLTYNGGEYHEGYNYLGYNERGFNREGQFRDGSDRDGDGYDARGFLANGNHRTGGLFNEQGQNMAGQSRTEVEELQIGKACYIPGANDHMARANQRDLKNFPADVVAVEGVSLDLTAFNTKDDFITGLHTKCQEYNAAVRANRGESLSQTRTRIYNNYRTNLVDFVHGGINPFTDEEYLWNIERRDIVKEYLTTITPQKMNVKTKVKFRGESGIDAGGLRKELFRTVVDKLQEKGVFKKLSDESKVWELNPAFNDFNFCTRANQDRNQRNCFENVGKMVGKILVVEQDYVDIPFSSYLLQKMLDNTPRSLVDFFSLAKLDDGNQLFKNQIETLTYDDPSLFGLVFAGMRGRDMVDYLNNGQDTDVTAGDIYLFTLLDLKYKMETVRSEVTQHFLRGFHSVANPGIFQFVGTNARELELMLRGISEIKADHIQPITRATGNARAQDSDRMIRWFWEIVREEEARDENFVAQLMVFWTSARTIPTDVANNNMRISVQSGGRGGRPADRLPTSHTCFNTLDLSVYPSKQALKQKLLQAVRFAQGFDE